ncbi:MAG: hypothetical protein COA39_003730 [Sulfurimonas sp.]|nr:hypothetical protein [Sulfurimonas sp.]
METWDNTISLSDKLYITGDDEILSNGKIRPQKLTAKEWIIQIIYQAKRELQELETFTEKADAIQEDIRTIRKEIKTNKELKYQRKRLLLKKRKIKLLEDDYYFYTTQKRSLSKEIRRVCFNNIKLILKTDFEYLKTIGKPNPKSEAKHSDYTSHIMYGCDINYIPYNQRANKNIQQYLFLNEINIQN